MNQCDESASVLSTQQFRHDVCPSFSTMLALWYDTLISLAYPPPTHTHTHTLVSLHAMCHSMSGNRAATMWRDEGEDFTLTPDSSHTFLTLWQLNDNTVNLVWLSLQYMKRIFSWWGKKGRHARSYAARWEGQSENSAQWPQSFSLVMFAGRSLCWLCIITSINVTQDAVPGNKTKIANCQFEYKD